MKLSEKFEQLVVDLRLGVRNGHDTMRELIQAVRERDKEVLGGTTYAGFSPDEVAPLFTEGWSKAKKEVEKRMEETL